MVVSRQDDIGRLTKVFRSIKQQSDQNFELILFKNNIEDESDLLNATNAELKSLKLSFLTSNKNLSFATALNLILQDIPDQDIIIRVDPDDICSKTRVSDTRQFFLNERCTNVICYGRVYEETPFGKLSLRKSIDVNNHFALRKLSNPIVHSSVAFRCGEIKSIGGYPNFQRAQDFALWLLAYKNGFQFKPLDKITGHFMLPKNARQKRGLSYLKSELMVYKFAYDIKYCSLLELSARVIVQVAKRILIQILPNKVVLGFKK